MKTVILKIKSKKFKEGAIKKAVEVLKRGGVLVFPTDTVYGLAASAFNLNAQRKIYKLKGRSFRKPLILMAHNIKSISNLVQISEKAKLLMDKFWPGPLTIVLPTTALGKMLMGGRNDVGIRIPREKIIVEIIKHLGLPIATTSANLSSKPSATNSNSAIKYFKNKTDLILDCGRCDLGRESTVVDMVKFPYLVVRQGCVPAIKILKCIT